MKRTLPFLCLTLAFCSCSGPTVSEPPKESSPALSSQAAPGPQAPPLTVSERTVQAQAPAGSGESPQTGEATPRGGAAGKESAPAAQGPTVKEPKRNPLEGKFKIPPWLQEAGKHMKAADEALERGDRKEAEAQIDRALAVKPSFLPAVTAKVKICREDGRHKDALSVLDAALAADPDNSGFVYEKAVALFSAGDLKASMHALQGILSQGGRIVDAKYLRARILAAEEDREGTLDALEDAAENGFSEPDRMEKEACFAFLHADQRFNGIVDHLRKILEPESRRTADELLPPSFPPEAPDRPELSQLEAELQESLQQDQGTVLQVRDMRQIDGKRLRLADHLGKVVILQFWGTWRGQSLQALQSIARLREELAEKGVEVFTLRYHFAEDRRSAAASSASFLKGNSLDLPCVIIDEFGAYDFRVSSYPCTLLLGKDGKVHLRAVGLRDYSSMRTLAEKLLAWTPPPAKAPETAGEKEPEKEAEKQ